MNDNTVLRIKVPAHLYESVKKQLTLKEAKGKTHYGAGMEVVKEKKLPKKGMEKVEEVGGGGVPSTNPSDMGIDIVDAPGSIVTKEAKTGRSLDELKAVKEKLDKKIHEMEKADKKEPIEENLNEASGGLELIQQIIADPTNTYDILKSAAGMATHEFDVLLAGLGTIASFLGGGIGLTIKNAVQKAKAEKGQA